MKINGLYTRVSQAVPKIEIAYEIEISSSGKSFSIDRGSNTDRYHCDFTFRGTLTAVNDIIEQLTTARNVKEQIVLTECEERFFGQNVDHSSNVNCLVLTIGEVEPVSLNSFEVSVSLVAGDLTFIGSPALPARLSCEQISSSSGGGYSAVTNSTYTMQNYQSDHRKDFPMFMGRYIFNSSEAESFMAFQKTNRGTPFQITSAQFGVLNMFGAQNETATHNVVLQSVEYERLSPVSWMAKIELQRVK